MSVYLKGYELINYFVKETIFTALKLDAENWMNSFVDTSYLTCNFILTESDQVACIVHYYDRHGLYFPYQS